MATAMNPIKLKRAAQLTSLILSLIIISTASRYFFVASNKNLKKNGPNTLTKS